MKKIKRIFLIFISVCIFGITIYTDYQSVKAFDIPTAFWGTLEASRAFWTALQAGGGVRGGGVSLGAFERSSREDMHNLQTQIMIAYTAFCIWKEKQDLASEHPDWSEEEINQEAETKGRLDSSRFQNSAIKVNDSTSNLTTKDYGYWKEYCDTMYDISVNGLEVDTYKCNVSNTTNLTLNNSLMENDTTNSFEFQGKDYCKGGQLDGIFTNLRLDKDLPLFVVCTYDTDEETLFRVRFYVNYLANFKVGEISGTANLKTSSWYSYNNLNDCRNFLQNVINDTNLPFFVIYRREYSDFMNNYIQANYDKLAINENVVNTDDYRRAIKLALDETEAGKAIKEGAKDGQEEIVREGYIPVKRSSVRTGEETATGVVGWDVPDTRTLEGAIAIPDTQDDVVEGMGIITVPKDKVTPKSDDTTVEWSKAEPISIPDTKDEPITKPIDDVISEQYGDYYPTQISLADFFPFCIPFDIYYCVQKFNVSQGEAPIIHIPIVYPRALQSVLGESYDVIIDFNNYIALRNIIRGFILLFFIIGLMQITRNLIRG